MKTASRILGSAFFREGFEVQDAPRYGAERRGAPVFAYVRAARVPIHERGVIRDPDLVVVADDTLIPIPAAGVLDGVDARTVLLVCTDEPSSTWTQRLNIEARVLTLPAAADSAEELRLLGATCAGAAARVLGIIPPDALTRAIEEELAETGAELLEQSRRRALDAYDRLADAAGCVSEGPDLPAPGPPPEWIDMPFDPARVSAPDIHAAATSVQVRTGLWRTVRPVIDPGRCNRCSWICSTACPDGAIEVGPDRSPRVDYDHCKGCMICVAVCPTHAIESVPEREAAPAPPEA